MPRLLLTGGTGLLGSRFVELMNSEWEIISLSKHKPMPEVEKFAQYEIVDLLDFSKLSELIQRFRPDAILHAAAQTQVDACEENPDLALLMNGKVTEVIAQSAQSLGAKLLYVSTDFVFDGQGEYDEWADACPINVYGQSKLAGEMAVQSLTTFWQIARIAFPYRSFFPPKVDLVRWMIESLRLEKPIQLIDDQEITPTFIDDAVYAMSALLQEGESGIYHVVSPQPITPFAMGHLIAKKFGFDPSLIVSISFDDYQSDLGRIAQRPRQSILLSEHLDAVLGYRMPTFLQGIERVKAQMAL